MWKRITHLGVLVLGDDITCAVGGGLVTQQLPVLGTNSLELLVQKYLSVISLAHKTISLIGYSNESATVRLNQWFTNHLEISQ